MLQVNNLVGFGAAAGGAPLVVAIDSTTTGTSSSITIPSGSRVSGYLGVLLDFEIETAAFATPNTNTQAGWTEIDPSGYAFGSSGGGIRVVCTYKILDGTETTVSCMNADGGSKHLYVFSADADITGVNIHFEGFSGTDGNPSAITVTSGSATAACIVCAIAGEFSAGNFGTTDTFDAETNTAKAEAGYKIFNSSPVDFDVDKDDEGSKNTLMAFCLEVS